MPIAKDIWRPLIVEASAEVVLRAGGIEGFRRHWLPEMPRFRFLADPFGLWRDGRLHVFVETYDYRTRHGTIECLLYNAGFALLERREVLREPWHLSYPLVFEAEGATWMLPEASRSGALRLYRAVEFPWRWERAGRIALDHVAVDATLFFHEGLWWLFYASADAKEDKTGALFAAWAERLAGPWRPHPANPVRRGFADTRPGGRVVTVDGAPVLPVQDCTRTYGGAIRPLRITAFTPDRFEAEAGEAIRPPAAFAPYTQGLHTLSAAGDVTLVDVKCTDASWRSIAMQVGRLFR